MNVQINQLVKSLLQKDSIEQCTLQELRQYAERHPYFGAAQLLLTKKLQSEDPVQYEEQLQKTYLFFHNPLWVEHLLNENGNASIIPGKQITHTEQEEKTVLEEIPVKSERVQVEQVMESTQTTLPAEEDKPASIQEPVTEAVAATETVTDNAPGLVNSAVEMAKTPAADTDMLFQPYHTVDYFASQGIKIRDDQKPTDKFGQQLKSFTDWLKVMKRLPVSEVTKNIDTRSEQKVEALAEHSIEDREVITEAMAEVWEKQKNYTKAIDIYRKLSLLDPSKSAYFAAKIDDLKKFN